MRNVSMSGILLVMVCAITGCVTDPQPLPSHQHILIKPHLHVNFNPHVPPTNIVVNAKVAADTIPKETSMDKSTFLAIIVALSAYLAAVRLALITLLGRKNKPKDAWIIKLYLGLLILADAALIVAGGCMIVYFFGNTLFGWEPGESIYTCAVWAFGVAFVILVVTHLVAWIVTIWKICGCGGGKQSSDTGPWNSRSPWFMMMGFGATDTNQPKPGSETPDDGGSTPG